jgi:hypothetical protein
MSTPAPFYAHSLHLLRYGILAALFWINAGFQAYALAWMWAIPLALLGAYLTWFALRLQRNALITWDEQHIILHLRVGRPPLSISLDQIAAVDTLRERHVLIREKDGRSTALPMQWLSSADRDRLKSLLQSYCGLSATLNSSKESQ